MPTSSSLLLGISERVTKAHHWRPIYLTWRSSLPGGHEPRAAKTPKLKQFYQVQSDSWGGNYFTPTFLLVPKCIMFGGFCHEVFYWWSGHACISASKNHVKQMTDLGDDKHEQKTEPVFIHEFVSLLLSSSPRASQVKLYQSIVEVFVALDKMTAASWCLFCRILLRSRKWGFFSDSFV